MTHDDKNPSLHDRVLERIEQGSVRMRPRSYFITRLVGVVLAALGVFIFSSFIASYIIFILSESGEHLLLSFGPRGALMFVMLFPWPLLLLDVIAVVMLRILLSQFRQVYRYSFLWVLGVLGVASIVFALALNATPLHSNLHERADADDLPYVGFWYEGIESPHEDYGEFRGTVLIINDRVFTIFHDDHDHDQDDLKRRIRVPDGFDVTTIEIGDEIYGAGFDEDRDGIIDAFGIRELPQKPPRR